MGYKIKKHEVDDVLSHDSASEVKALEDVMAGGDNLVAPVDHLSAGGSKEKSVQGIEIYKIAESILKKITKKDEA